MHNAVHEALLQKWSRWAKGVQLRLENADSLLKLKASDRPLCVIVSLNGPGESQGRLKEIKNL